jgi:hypothetical protein
MRYLFQSTYTPFDPVCDRRRKGTVVLSEAGVLDAITGALSSLEMAGLHDDVISEYLDQSGDEDTSEGFAWEVGSNNGEYHFEIEPFDPKDPVTKEAILAWAQGLAQEAEPGEATRELLWCLLGRWFWRSLEWQDAGDLRESLHELVTSGPAQKPYCDYTIDECLTQIVEEIVEAQRDNFDEIRKGVPFGMAAMVENDKPLWLDE